MVNLDIYNINICTFPIQSICYDMGIKLSAILLSALSFLGSYFPLNYPLEIYSSDNTKKETTQQSQFKIKE